MRTVFERGAHTPFAAHWLVDAEWAHPFWSQYVIELSDLTTDIGEAPTLYMPGATHEFVLTAIQKDYPLRQDVSLAEQDIHRLTPANHGYQFKAENDEAALGRIELVIRLIQAKRLSPDTDARRVWDHLFSDGVSLHKDSGLGLVLDAVVPDLARAG